jgi:hypothetical protein
MPAVRKVLIAALAVAALPGAVRAHFGLGIGINLGVPVYPRPYYYPYPYYYRPYPVVVAAPPPPVVVVPAAAPVAAVPVVQAAPVPVVQAAPVPPPPPPAPVAPVVAHAPPSPAPVTPAVAPAPLPPAPIAVAQPVAANEASRSLNELHHADERVRAEAAVQLGRAQTGQAVGPLSASLAGDGSPAVREAAARALGLIGDAAALPALERAAGADPDAEVRHSARFAAEGIRAQPH